MARLKYFPERLRAAREKKGWSISELARRSGVSASNIARIESGEGTVGPGLYIAMELCRTLEISMKELTGL